MSDRDSKANVTRELPQSLGIVAHIWASKREPADPAAAGADADAPDTADTIDLRDAPEVISLDERAAARIAD